MNVAVIPFPNPGSHAGADEVPNTFFMVVRPSPRGRTNPEVRQASVAAYRGVRTLLCQTII